MFWMSESTSINATDPELHNQKIPSLGKGFLIRSGHALHISS
jgi:hypothetical protein